MSAEGSPQFVDSNVLVYAHDRSAGRKRDRAAALLDELWASEAGCLSIQVLQEFYVTVTQKVPQPLDQQTAARIVADLSHWRVHTPTAAAVLGAIKLQQRYQMSFWDAMIVASAAQLGCAVIWTEDLNPGQTYGEVRVANPFEAA